MRDKEKLKAYMKAYVASHREEVNARRRAYDAAHREDRRAYRAAHRKEQRRTYLRIYGTLKKQVYDVYFTGECAGGCGEKDSRVLSIDHIDQKGADHRQAIGAGTLPLCRWIIRNNFPAGFRILCPTCQRKAFLGIPLPNESHEEVRR